MKPTTTALSIDDLLPLEDFVRSLARRLVRDAAEADDVVQEALLMAWKSPPRDKAALPAWFGTVVRRLASRSRQKDKAREQRERAAARPDSLVPSPEDVLHREEKRRLVVEQLLALPENHREVLLLHYYEGLSPKEIAARLSRPAGTVRSQLKRGLDELRERLDRTQDGDRRSWALALIPLTKIDLGRPALAVSGGLIVGVLAMKKTILTTVVLLAVASWGMLDSWMDNGNTPIEENPAETVGALGASTQDEDVPTGLDPVPVEKIGRTEITNNSSSDANQGAIQLELLDAQGQPCVDLAYGVIVNDFGIAREGWAYEVISSLENNLLASAARSTEQGVLRLHEKKKGFLLWVQKHDQLYEFFDLEKLPEDGKLRLAPEQKFQVVCPGLDEEERWHLYLQPGIKDQEDGSWSLGLIFRKLAEKKGSPLYLAMEVHKTVQKGGDPVELWVPEGQPFNVELVVERHDVTFQGEKYEVRMAPATWRFLPGPLLPKVEVAFVGANGKPLAPQSGVWAVMDRAGNTNFEKFENQNPLLLPFQAFKDDSKYRIQVITNKGDYEDWEIESGKTREDKLLRLVRAKAPGGLRLAVPEPFSGTERLELYAETEKGGIRGSADLFKASWMHGRPLPAFIPAGKELIFLQDKKYGFKRLWIHTPDGQLAVYDPAEKGTARFRALPHGGKQKIDLHKLYKKILAVGPTRIELFVELRPGIVLKLTRMKIYGTGTRWAHLSYHLTKGKKTWLKVTVLQSSRAPLKIDLPLEKQD